MRCTGIVPPDTEKGEHSGEAGTISGHRMRYNAGKEKKSSCGQRQDAKDRRRERYVVTGGSGSFIIIYLGVWGDFRQDAPKEAQKTACGKKIIAFLRRGLHWRGSKTGGAPAACSIFRFVLS